MHFAEARVV